MPPAPASSGTGCGRSCRGRFTMGLAQGMPRGYKHRAVSPFPEPERGDGEGSWEGALGSARCCCTAEGMGFSPKTRLHGTEPWGGWAGGAGAVWHSSSKRLGHGGDLMLCHCSPSATSRRGDEPARAWDPAVTPPGQAAAPPASAPAGLGAPPRREGLGGSFQPATFQPRVLRDGEVSPPSTWSNRRAEHQPHSNTLAALLW